VGAAAFAIAGISFAGPAKADVDVKQEALKAVIQNIPGEHSRSDPDAALGYTKAPPLVAAPAPEWIYGVNLVGGGDKSYALNTSVSSGTGVGAFDATKIGIFTATNALTFVLTGSDTWALAAMEQLTPLVPAPPSGRAEMVPLLSSQDDE